MQTASPIVRLSALWAAAFLLGYLSYSQAAVIRGPYLQSQSDKAIVVRWRTDSSQVGRVKYGLARGSLGQSADESSAGADHEVRIQGLAAGTRYYYALANTSGTILAGDDADHYFTTSPSPGTIQPTRIWVIGDSGTKDQNARNVRDAMLGWITANPWAGATRPDLWLMLGDNAYSDGKDGEYQAAVFDMYPTILRNTVVWPCIGNHDARNALGFSSDSEAGVYFDIFTLPRQAEAGGLTSGTEAYYSYDYANIHFIVLDSEDSSRSTTGPMLTWAKNDAAATSQDWIIAFWHHPPYSKGSHDSDSDGQLRAMRQNALPFLEAAGVDLVLTGHSHSYERSKLLDGHYGTSNTLTSAMVLDAGDGREGGDGAYEKPTGGLAPNEGAVYVVAGSSGKTSFRDRPGFLKHPVMVSSLLVLGSVILDVNGLQLDAYFIDDRGTVRDSFTLQKGTVVDLTPPSAVRVLATGDPTTLEVVFNERVMAGTGAGGAENIANYALPGSPLAITGASLDPLGRTVTLTLDAAMTNGASYSLTVLGVSDRASPPNVIQTAQMLAFTFNTGPVVVFRDGDTWQYFKGTRFPGASWNQLGFNDSSWLTGKSGFGYADGDDATVLSDMEGNYVTVYMRKSFTVADASTASALTFTVDYDDGFVAFLNGTEVARRGVPAGQDQDTTAVTGHAASVDGGLVETIDLAGFIGDLVTGTNVFAIEVHNKSLGSSDLTMIPGLEITGGQSAPAPDTTPPLVQWSGLVLTGLTDDPAATVTTSDGTLVLIGAAGFTWTAGVSLGGGSLTVTVTDGAGNATIRRLTLTP